MAKKHAFHLADGHLDPDSSLDLPGSPNYHSSPTAPSMLNFSSPLAASSTPDSSILEPSILCRHGPHGGTGRYRNSSALGKLVSEDMDWKRQTEEQRRGLQDTPHCEFLPRDARQPWAAKFDPHPSFDSHDAQLYGKNPGRTIKQFSHDLYGAVPPGESVFNYGHYPAATSTNNIDDALLSCLRGLNVNDYSSFNNPPSSGSDEDSMAYLSPFRGATASSSRGPSTGATLSTGPNDKNLPHRPAGVTGRQTLWTRNPCQHQTTDRCPTAAGPPSHAPGPSMSSSLWAQPRPTGVYFLPSNQLIQQHPQLAPAAFPPTHPLPPLPTSDSIFHPMESRPLDEQVTGVAAMDLMVKGFSPNYRGNPDLERNRSAPIPPDQNCSLFITGLAPTLTTTQLLATIRDVGRVYATHINFPEPDRGHFTCAAKVVFFERSAAERFYERYAGTGFRVAGTADLHVGRVVWNRIRSAEQDVGGRKSRVLLISGPPGIVSEKALKVYFNTKIQYQVDEVRTLRRYAANGLGGAQGGEERALVEFRFGSYRCQSEAARMALSREFKEFGVFCDFGEYFRFGVLVVFRGGRVKRGNADEWNQNKTGQDPCDLASTFLPGKENIDNDPAFASSASQPDETGTQYLDHPTTAQNWHFNGEC